MKERNYKTPGTSIISIPMTPPTLEFTLDSVWYVIEYRFTNINWCLLKTIQICSEII